MTIQWTLIATFLYFELAFIAVLLLPFISSKIWKIVVYSRVCKMVAAKANMYFTILIIVLILFFLDSIRETMRYSVKNTKDYGAELQMNMKLFRSQRNYYISGFTVFLWLVLRKLLMLILIEADLLTENETAMKRAQDATETLQKIIKREKIANVSSKSTSSSDCEEIIAKLHKALNSAKSELDKEKKAIQDTKDKCKEVSEEYELLLQEHLNLEKQI